MRRIDNPYTLKEVLARLSEGPLTPAQARLLLASRGIRAQQKVVEAALRMMKAPAVAPAKTQRARIKSLDDLPLTPQERAVMERLRRKRA